MLSRNILQVQKKLPYVDGPQRTFERPAANGSSEPKPTDDAERTNGGFDENAQNLKISIGRF
jgi:hypothetical protein